MMDIPPSQTIYINNINDSVKKETLRRNLYQLFSQYGAILDVVALKTWKLRGQAWVVFETIGAASSARRQMQNFPFHGKPLHISYAKSKSDAVAKADGTFIPKHLRRIKPVVQGPVGAILNTDGVEEEEDEENNVSNTKNDMDVDESEPSIAEKEHNTLICTDLPEECTQEMLNMLFQQFGGLQEIRMVPSKHIAFIEFSTILSATEARKTLLGFRLSPTETLQVEFAKQ